MGGKLGKQHTYVVSGACGGDTKQVVEPKRRESLHDSIGSGGGLVSWLICPRLALIQGVSFFSRQRSFLLSLIRLNLGIHLFFVNHEKRFKWTLSSLSSLFSPLSSSLIKWIKPFLGCWCWYISIIVWDQDKTFNILVWSYGQRFACSRILGCNKESTIFFKISLCSDEPVYIPSGTRRKSVFAEVLFFFQLCISFT